MERNCIPAIFLIWFAATAIGCGDGRPSTAAIEKVVLQSLEKSGPPAMGSGCMSNTSVANVTVFQVGEMQTSGNRKYWPVRVNVKGTCNDMMRRSRAFEGGMEYEIDKDAYGEWTAHLMAPVLRPLYGAAENNGPADEPETPRSPSEDQGNTKSQKFAQELVAALADNDLNLTTELLEAGADVSGRDEAGRTTLMLAVGWGNIVASKMLLEAGVDINAKDDLGWTALIVAARDSNPVAIELLLEGGADVNGGNADGWSALGEACSRSEHDTRAVELLLEAGANINFEDHLGMTPLMHAASFGRLQVVVRLLEAGADVHVRNKMGTGITKPGATALTFAEVKEHTEIIELLKMASSTDPSEWDFSHMLPRKTSRNEHLELIAIQSRVVEGGIEIAKACQQWVRSQSDPDPMEDLQSCNFSVLELPHEGDNVQFQKRANGDTFRIRVIEQATNDSACEGEFPFASSKQYVLEVIVRAGDADDLGVCVGVAGTELEDIGYIESFY